MTKLTELEKQKAITCVGYIEGKFRCDRYKLESKLNREMDKLPPEEIAKIKSTFITEDTPDAMWTSLLRLTDLIYKELQGQQISISKEMLLEYYQDLR